MPLVHGKTTITNILKEKLKASVVDADKIARQLSKKGNKYYDAIVKCFGPNVLDENRELNRKYLANIVYNDQEKIKELNMLTEEYVLPEIKKQVISEEQQGVVLMDVPLLIESGLNDMCNVVVSTIASMEAKLNRIKNRDNITKQEAEDRIKIQPENEFYIKNSDYVIENNEEEMQEIIKQVENIIEKIGGVI